MVRSRPSFALAACAALLACLVPQRAAAAPTLFRIGPPVEPRIDTRWGDPWTTVHNDHAGARQFDYHVFEPTGRAEAPVVVYFHGASTAPEPDDVRTQIDEYVRSGFTVVWVRYCDPGDFFCFNRLQQQPTNAAWAVVDALAYLRSADHVRPSMSTSARPELTFVAHSMGTIIAMRAAAALGALSWIPGSPVPQALVLHDPVGPEVLPFVPLEPADLATIPPTTLQVVLVAEASAGNSRSRDVVTRIHMNSPATRKFAWIVPHACATDGPLGSVSYVCPSLSHLADDEITANHTYYYSGHDATIDRPRPDAALRQPSGHAGAAIFDHTIACVREVATETPQSACSGEQASYAGRFFSLGAGFVEAPRKRPYFATRVPPPAHL